MNLQLLRLHLLCGQVGTKQGHNPQRQKTELNGASCERNSYGTRSSTTRFKCGHFVLVRHKLSELTAGSNSKASLVTAGVPVVQLQTLRYVLLLLLLLQLVRPGCFPNAAAVSY